MANEMAKRFSTALMRLAGDEELLVAMASMVTDDAPKIVEQLLEHLQRAEMKEVAASAHKLKGMLSTFETESPVTDLEEVVLAARAGDARAATEEFQGCRPGIDELLREIAALTE